MYGDLWHSRGGGDQHYPQEKEMQEGLVGWEGLIDSWGKKEKWKAREKGKDIPNWTQSSREREGEIDKKPFLNEQCKEIEKTIAWETLEISSRKLELPREHFMQRWAQWRTEMVWTAGVQPWLIQSIRRGDGFGEDQDTIASIRH